ncbi:MAG: hypothetical protein QXN26_06775 [Thermoplasmataceae archaeon]
MKPLLKAILVIAIAVGIAVPSGYIAYQSFVSSNPSMINFVPENSTAVIRADYNGTQLYIFNSGNNTGVVINMGISQVSSVFKGSASNVSGNTSVSVSPTYLKSYDGYRIYYLSNVSISLGRTLGNLSSVYAGNTINLSSFIHNNTIYIAELSGATVSVGTLRSVEYSISAMSGGKSFSSQESRYFKSGSNVSIYLNYSNIYFHSVTGNIFYNTSSFQIVFTNQTIAKSAFQVIGTLRNVTSLSINNNEVNVTLSVGMNYLNGNLSKLFSTAPLNLNGRDL